MSTPASCPCLAIPRNSCLAWRKLSPSASGLSVPGAIDGSSPVNIQTDVVVSKGSDFLNYACRSVFVDALHGEDQITVIQTFAVLPIGALDAANTNGHDALYKGQFTRAAERTVIAEMHIHRLVAIIEVRIEQDDGERPIFLEAANQRKCYRVIAANRGEHNAAFDDGASPRGCSFPGNFRVKMDIDVTSIR